MLVDSELIKKRFTELVSEAILNNLTDLKTYIL